MRYKIEVKRKYIYISPTPKKNIEKGLWVVVKNPLGICVPLNFVLYTDLLKGKNKYEKPYDLITGRYFEIGKVWIKNKKNENSKRHFKRKRT